MKTIRLGIVRCDTHAYWYMPHLVPCDPLLLEKYDHECHHYYSTISRADQLRVEPVPGFEITAVWDVDPKRAEAFSQTALGTAKVCDTPEAMIEHIDAVFIADCLGDGADHLTLARPFLEAGIAVFVDKPLAPCLSEAVAMIEMAKRCDTCLMSASLLEYNPTAKQFARRFDEVGPVGMVVVKGIGGAGLAGIIHGISLMRNLLGDGVEWVQSMGTTQLDPSVATKVLNQSDFTQWNGGEGFVPMTYVHVHYKTGQEALIINTSADLFPPECSFYASAYSKRGAIHSPPIGDPEFLAGGRVIVELFEKMIRTGKPTVSYDSLIEKIAILDAARMSQHKGQPVRLDEMIPCVAAT